MRLIVQFSLQRANREKRGRERERVRKRADVRIRLARVYTSRALLCVSLCVHVCVMCEKDHSRFKTEREGEERKKRKRPNLSTASAFLPALLEVVCVETGLYHRRVRCSHSHCGQDKHNARCGRDHGEGRGRRSGKCSPEPPTDSHCNMKRDGKHCARQSGRHQPMQRCGESPLAALL